MADWYGTARSNYFLVKDKEQFEQWANNLNLKVQDDTEEKDKVCLLVDEHSNGAWPSNDPNTWEEINLVKEIAGHLVENEVVVLLEIGGEKQRYLTGNAVAFNHTGDFVQVNLNDIYKLAKQKFNTEVTLAEY